MKTIFLAFFLLLAFSTTLPSTTAEEVYDIDGQPLSFSDRYHIIPAFRGRGGGLELGKTGNETCPLTVVQARSDVNLGLAVEFLFPLPTPNNTITEGLSLIIRFPEQPSCVPGFSSWVVAEEFPVGWSVKVAYNLIRFGPFRIEKYEKFGQHDYKLVYCPGNGNVCGDLGIHKRRLVVRDEHPFIVRFKKAIAGNSAE